MVEEYVCSKSEGCAHQDCTHRQPHELNEEKCYAPPGHFSERSYSCWIMPETRCVPLSQLEKSAKQ